MSGLDSAASLASTPANVPMSREDQGPRRTLIMRGWPIGRGARLNWPTTAW